MTFTPNDSPCQNAGEGITRTIEPGARFWPVEVAFASAGRCGAPSALSPNNRRISLLSVGILTPAQFVFFLGKHHGFD